MLLQKKKTNFFYINSLPCEWIRQQPAAAALERVLRLHMKSAHEEAAAGEWHKFTITFHSTFLWWVAGKLASSNVEIIDSTAWN